MGHKPGVINTCHRLAQVVLSMVLKGEAPGSGKSNLLMTKGPIHGLVPIKIYFLDHTKSQGLMSRETGGKGRFGPFARVSLSITVEFLIKHQR